jgi:hypothetical protein
LTVRGATAVVATSEMTTTTPSQPNRRIVFLLYPYTPFNRSTLNSRQ